MLTGNDTGAANAFTITNGLTGGAGITFGANAVEALDAAATINNIAITSATNTIDGAVPGATVTLLKKDPATTVTVTVTRDDQAFKADIDQFVEAYNNLTGYIDSQFASAAEGTGSSIGRDGLLWGLRTTLRSTISQAYSVGGTYSYLSEVGIGTDVSGQLTVDATLLDDALATNFNDLQSLFVGNGGTSGAFATLEAVVTAYTESGGLIPDVQARIDDQISSIDDRIIRLEEQLEIRRASLEEEFIAADLLISQLNSQLGSLNGIVNQFSLL